MATVATLDPTIRPDAGSQAESIRTSNVALSPGATSTFVTGTSSSNTRHHSASVDNSNDISTPDVFSMTYSAEASGSNGPPHGPDTTKSSAGVTTKSPVMLCTTRMPRFADVLPESPAAATLVASSAVPSFHEPPRDRRFSGSDGDWS